MSIKKGFTLIELLVVIGIMAVLAAGVVALINPLEKNRQAQDSKVFNDISSMSTAVQSMAATTVDGAYPCPVAAALCINPAISMSGAAGIITNASYVGNGAVGQSGELQTVPQPPNAGAAPYGNYLYFTNGGARPTAFQILAKLGSAKYNSQCAAATPNAYYMYDTTVGRACIKCLNAVPAAYAAGGCSINL